MMSAAPSASISVMISTAVSTSTASMMSAASSAGRSSISSTGGAGGGGGRKNSSSPPIKKSKSYDLSNHAVSGISKESVLSTLSTVPVDILTQFNSFQ